MKKAQLIPIVGDGAIAAPFFGDGRLIPVLIVDCENCPALRDLILLHQGLPPGDVVSTWGIKRFKNWSVNLHLDFSRPLELSVMFRFDARKQSALLDGIVKAKGVYLQPASSGMKVSEGLANPKVLIEVPAELPRWESIYLDVIFSNFVSSGFSRKEAKQAAAEHISRMREFWSRGIRNLMSGKGCGK